VEKKAACEENPRQKQGCEKHVLKEKNHSLGKEESFHVRSKVRKALVRAFEKRHEVKKSNQSRENKSTAWEQEKSPGQQRNREVRTNKKMAIQRQIKKKKSKRWGRASNGGRKKGSHGKKISKFLLSQNRAMGKN